jgi:dTDP-4-dehydrorhamnose reductase|tara:strand:- start:33 stop:746 length:714 start_codon:yes stop_codon:yes gene_type:complete
LIVKKRDILILGDGLLGSEIKRQTGWENLSRNKNNFDLTKNLHDFNDKISKYNGILNCIAHTDTYSYKKDPHWKINYAGVVDLVSVCNNLNKKLIHISTDYVYANSTSNAKESDVPVHCENWYGYTKLLGDAYVQLKSTNYLLIRTTHKPKPFPYDKAWNNHIGNFDYVDKIAELIILLIKNNAVGVYNVGTEKKTMYELAKLTNKNVSKTSEKFHSSSPDDVTMDTEKMIKFLDSE